MAYRKGVGAKKKKRVSAKKTTTRKRRRVSGIGKIDFGGIAMKAAGLTVGAAGARVLNTVAIKQFPTLTPMISALGQIAIGIALPMFVKNNKFLADVGDGMVANGGMVLIVSTGAISGALGAAMSDNGSNMVTYRINGRNRLAAVAGTGRLSAVAGQGKLSAVAGLNSRNAVAGMGARRTKYRGMVGCID